MATSPRFPTASRKRDTAFPVPLPALLMVALFAVLLVAGGGSRGDILGQAVTRAGAALGLAGVLLVGRFDFDGLRAILTLLSGAIVLVLIQLVPLPPIVWHSLPERMLIVSISDASLWRPWSMVPDATVNAASSLLVPFAVLVLLAAQGAEYRVLPNALLGVIVGSALWGMVQASGTFIDNPLINGGADEVSGTFANRNHFALFVAFGCTIVPIWALSDPNPWRWRAPVALTLVVLFFLTILVTGSRAGLLLGALGAAIATVACLGSQKMPLRKHSRWRVPLLIGGVAVLLIAAATTSILSHRAISVERALTVDASNDLRWRTAPVVTRLAYDLLPFGGGFGSFTTLYARTENDKLLSPYYLNHAHNDFLEVVLDGGVLAAILVGASLFWWIIASARVWRSQSTQAVLFGRAGSAMLGLTFMASAVDYPARTPMIMATAVIAAAWLGWGATAARRMRLR